MQLFLSKDVDNDVRFGEEDCRLDEGNGLIATVAANNNGKMDTVSPNSSSPIKINHHFYYKVIKLLTNIDKLLDFNLYTLMHQLQKLNQVRTQRYSYYCDL